MNKWIIFFGTLGIITVFMLLLVLRPIALIVLILSAFILGGLDHYDKN
jgi:hypothetical protein